MKHQFWDLTPGEREAAYAAACEQHGAEDFFDLEPEQRRQVMDDAVSGAFEVPAGRPL